MSGIEFTNLIPGATIFNRRARHSCRASARCNAQASNTLDYTGILLLSCWAMQIPMLKLPPKEENGSDDLHVRDVLRRSGKPWRRECLILHSRIRHTQGAESATALPISGSAVRLQSVRRITLLLCISRPVQRLLLSLYSHRVVDWQDIG